jgi:hypothetical protein
MIKSLLRQCHLLRRQPSPFIPPFMHAALAIAHRCPWDSVATTARLSASLDDSGLGWVLGVLEEGVSTIGEQTRGTYGGGYYHIWTGQ